MEITQGQRFGRLTTIRPEMRSGQNNDKDIPPREYWLCKCDCGNEKFIPAHGLKYQNTQSCGCLTKENASKRSLIDLTGKRIGRLTVIERAENKNGKVMWKCKCDCGNETIVCADCLNAEKTKSCGCLLKEHEEKFVKQYTKHGKCHTRLYSIYCDIKKRCDNINSATYIYYGDKGIKMCDEWSEDFMSFYNWAMNNGYKDGLTIDRIDSHKGYEPSNCQWITKSENIARRNVEYFASKRKEKEIMDKIEDDLKKMEEAQMSSGYAIRIPYDAVLPARGSLTFDSGIMVEIPKGYIGMIVSDNSLNIKHSITATGTVNCGESDSIVIKLNNNGFQNYHFLRGDKTAFLMVVKVATPEIEPVSKLS